MELTHCDNKMVTKVALALLALVEEMDRLEQEVAGELVPPLAVYSEGGPGALGKLLPTLQVVVREITESMTKTYLLAAHLLPRLPLPGRGDQPGAAGRRLAGQQVGAAAWHCAGGAMV